MKKFDAGFVIAGSLMTIAFLILVNVITSSNELWSIYPAVVLLLFLIGFFLLKTKRYIMFSVVSSLLIGLFLIVENYLHTPGYPWVLYTLTPLWINPFSFH